MAVAFLDRQPLSRRLGHSTIAKAAYNACTAIADEDYRKKSSLAYSKMITLDDLPAPDRATFWQGVEAAERRIDAQVGYSYTAALPRELTHNQRIALAESYARQIALRYDLTAVDLAIHYPTKRRRGAKQDQENPHLHLLTPTRTRDGKKWRLYGKADDLITCRQIWEEEVNHALKEAGLNIKISMENSSKQLEKKEKEIQLLEEKEKDIEKQLKIIKEKRKNGTDESAKMDNLHTGEDMRENKPDHSRNQKNQETANRFRTRYQPSIRQDRSSSGRPSSSTEYRGESSPSGHTRSTGRDRERLGRSLQLAARAETIADRVKALRLQRTSKYFNNRIIRIGKHIASRLEALRYERTATYRNTSQDQDINPIYRPTC